MTTETQTGPALMPFLLRFSEALPYQEAVRMKYDYSRQVSLVEVDGQWMDATVSNVVAGGTYMTKVQAETTDDN
jgi:hypothetical protein